MRDIGFLERQAIQHGAAIGCFAHHVLEGPLPWTRMRRVYALLAFVRRYGESRVEQTCRLALDAQMYDVRRLERIRDHPGITRTQTQIVLSTLFERPFEE